jgi:hypothetical protein
VSCLVIHFSQEEEEEEEKAALDLLELWNHLCVVILTVKKYILKTPLLSYYSPHTYTQTNVRHDCTSGLKSECEISWGKVRKECDATNSVD